MYLSESLVGAMSRRNQKQVPRESALVVDDEPRSQMYLTRVVESIGYKAVCFPDALKALRYFSRYKADIALALVDYRLPGMDGLIFAERARGICPSCPIVLISSYAAIQDVEHGYEIGTDDFVVRPITEKELAERLVKARERRKKLSEHLIDESEQVLKRLNFDSKKRAVDWFGKRITLTPRELQIIGCLTREPGRYYKFSEIYLAVYGISTTVMEAKPKLMPMVKRLRYKLEEGELPRVIEGKRRFGLRWNDELLTAFGRVSVQRRKRGCSNNLHPMKIHSNFYYKTYSNFYSNFWQ